MKMLSSKDFHTVKSQINVDVPLKLIHKNVLNRNVEQHECEFSKERAHVVKIVDLPSLALNMTIGELNPNQSTRRHRHNYETIIYIVEGIGKSLIEEVSVLWEKGDAIYVPVWAWHNHINLSNEDKCIYIACENAALLQNLNVALREEL